MLLRCKTIWLLLLLLVTVSCTNNQELPTLVPTAEIQSTLPPTSTVTVAPATITPSPEFSPSASVTPVLPTVEATSVVGSGVNITTPNVGTELLLGSEVLVGGLVQLEPDDNFVVTLNDARGLELAQGNIQVNDFNSWQATITIPESTSGHGHVRATVRNSNGEIVASDEQPITLVVDKEKAGRYLELFRPDTDANSVAGYYLFFDGRANLPVNNLLSVSLWAENCSIQVARQSYRLRGSGYWQGFVVVPRDIFGEVCAIVSFGDRETADGREALVKLNVLPPTDENAKGVLIGNPPPNSLIRNNRTILIYGTAFNAPSEKVSVNILLENSRLINEGETTVDNNGYWELELYLPADTNGTARIKAAVGDSGDDNYMEDLTTVTISQN